MQLPAHQKTTLGINLKMPVSCQGTESITPHTKVSAVIITYNEASIIEQALSKLQWCDEIIIVDSGSSDDTVSICKQHKCQVYNKPFIGFDEQKNFGASKACYDWILCIDADEIISDALINEIRVELNKHDGSYVAYTIPRDLVFMGQVFKYGKEAGQPVIRLFNKQYAHWDNAVVHERVNTNGAIKQLSGNILHYSYHSYSQFLHKINLYSTLGAQKLYAKNKTRSKAIMLLGLPFNFIKYYFIDGNFLNGYKGFTWSLFNTIYHFLKYVKLEELRKKAPAPVKTMFNSINEPSTYPANWAHQVSS